MKYREIKEQNNIPLVAIAFQTYGGLHKDAIELTHKIIKHRNRGPLAMDTKASLFKKLSELSVSIMRDNAIMVARAHKRVAGSM